MKLSDIRRHLPLDADWDLEKTLIFSGAVLSAVYAVVGFMRNYNLFVNGMIYVEYNSVRILREGVMAPDFYSLLSGVFTGWKILALCMIALVVYHYLLHFQGGSRSIYTMRRLPKRFELHRRCLTVPVVTALACLGCVIVLTALFYLGYMIFTPKQCINPNQLGLLWQWVFGF